MICRRKLSCAFAIASFSACGHSLDEGILVHITLDVTGDDEVSSGFIAVEQVELRPCDGSASTVWSVPAIAALPTYRTGLTTLRPRPAKYCKVDLLFGPVGPGPLTLEAVGDSATVRTDVRRLAILELAPAITLDRIDSRAELHIGLTLGAWTSSVATTSEVLDEAVRTMTIDAT